MIRVFIVEDQALVRGAIVALLSLDQDIEVIGDAENGQVAKEKLKSLSPDVVLTDIEMPHITGLELAQHLQQTQPNCKVVIMTTFSKAGYHSPRNYTRSEWLCFERSAKRVPTINLKKK